MNNLKSTKINAILLAAILVAGTITAVYPSFVIGAQAQPFYGMNSYDDDRKSYDKRSYGNDYGYDESQYQHSYKPDYKPQYQSYGEKDDRRDKSNKDNSKSIEINKINCINSNININGNNTGDINLGNKGQGYLGANAYGDGEGNNGEGYYYDGQNYKNNDDKGSDCIINNNNTNNNIAGGGNQTTTKATLNVSKIVTCTYQIGGLTPETACGLIEENITENQFLIEVTDDNPTPSQFPGSESGTIVTLGAGNYVVSETFDAASLQTQIEKLEAELKRLAGGGGRDYNITGPIVSFTGDCNAVNLGSEATGTIAGGESQTCEIENHFDIGLADEICTNGVDDDGDGLVDAADPDCTTQGGLTASNINTSTSSSDINTPGGLVASSFSSQPTIAQGTEASSSALEKVTKLKKQWLELLP